jgi:hypothetical protein
MANPAFSRGARKALRTVVQVAAGGALTALVTALSGHFDPEITALIMGAWIAFVAFAQNWAEAAGKIPVLLPAPGLITTGGTLVGKAVGAVDTVGRSATTVIEDVVDGTLGSGGEKPEKGEFL